MAPCALSPWGGHVARRARRIRVVHRFDAEFADQLPALTKRHDMGVDGFQICQTGAGHAKQLMLDPLEVLADDMQARMGHQVVHVTHPARDRVFDRHHGERRLAKLNGGEHVLE